MSNAKIYYGKIPVGEGKPQVLNVVDNLTSTDPEKALSANQGYVLSQKFMKDIKVTQNNELIITYFNGNTFVYDLSAFLSLSLSVYVFVIMTLLQFTTVRTTASASLSTVANVLTLSCSNS